ncbi:MAG TPA: DUF5615 family PIN-like protein [Urbifossiella sp.]|nr:DUF5615 family PIN-like protein [Urbifossiella sp.]
MARLYADENVPLNVVTELRQLGHDVVTIQERGRGGEKVSDPEVLTPATAEGRAAITINRRHFKRLHLVPLVVAVVAATSQSTGAISNASTAPE